MFDMLKVRTTEIQILEAFRQEIFKGPENFARISKVRIRIGQNFLYKVSL